MAGVPPCLMNDMHALGPSDSMICSVLLPDICTAPCHPHHAGPGLQAAWQGKRSERGWDHTPVTFLLRAPTVIGSGGLSPRAATANAARMRAARCTAAETGEHPAAAAAAAEATMVTRRMAVTSVPLSSASPLSSLLTPTYASTLVFCSVPGSALKGCLEARSADVVVACGQ